MKIGFFDSGLGGLTILRAVVTELPQYEYVFYGDTAHVPYGDREEDEVYQLTEAGVNALFAEDCTLVIIACNTASAETVRRLQDTLLPQKYPDRRILGVIVPTVEEVIASGSQHTLLLATKRTVASGKYEREFAVREASCELTSVTTPSLVGLIEQWHIEQAVLDAKSAIEHTLQSSPDIDSCVLGCTHYTVLKQLLRKEFPDVRFLTQDEIIPTKLVTYLRGHPEISNRLHTTGGQDIILSDTSVFYNEVASEFLKGIGDEFFTATK